MSLLAVGQQCSACAVVDFLPFTCPHCARVFCKEHIHAHDECAAQRAASAAASTERKRVRGTCAKAGCDAETIESIGGLDTTAEDAEGDIARRVRCLCGDAFCLAHRAQAAHDCPAPREDTARYDAGEARKAAAQEVLRRTMPEHAGKARLSMPAQVDRTPAGPKRDPNVLPPSVIAEREAEAARAAQATAAETPDATAAPTSAEAIAGDLSPVTAPSSAPASTAASAWTCSPAYAKLHKMHCVKIRSLAKPLDARAPRDQSLAVEWTVDLSGKKVKTWDTDGIKPDKAAAALGERKPERIWVPEAMPGGKLFDTLVAAAKPAVSREKLSLVRVALSPGAQPPPTPLDLGRPAGEQLAHGDVLVIIGT